MHIESSYRIDRRVQLALLFVLLLLMLMRLPVKAQSQPVVVFLVGREVDSASYADITATGLSKLADILVGMGADVQLLETGKPIPESAKLVVVARPLRTISIAQAARLWLHLRRGNHLLLAVDPDNYFLGYANANSRITRTPLQGLFTVDYGIIMRNSFLAEPWFTTETITDIHSAFTLAAPETIPNPITEPLMNRDIPIQVWGARHLDVEPFGLDSYAIPLLSNQTGYAETETNVFARRSGRRVREATETLEVNLGQDAVGRLLLGALGVNTETGSRIVVLGDSEILQNGFGLAGTPLNPVYPANRVFVERMAAWLLDLPPNAWPDLPRQYTWITVDGDSSDWSNIEGAASLDANSLGDSGITGLQVFRDDNYAYFLIDHTLPVDTQLTIKTTTDDAESVIVIDRDEVRVQDEDGNQLVVPDAKISFGNSMELRLPLRVFSTDPKIHEICLQETTCVSLAAIPIYRVSLRAPYDYSLSDNLIATVSSTADVNLRSDPSTNNPPLTTIPSGAIVAAIGRNEDGGWIRIRSALYDGWMAEFLLEGNGDFDLLPILADVS